MIRKIALRLAVTSGWPISMFVAADNALARYAPQPAGVQFVDEEYNSNVPRNVMLPERQPTTEEFAFLDAVIHGSLHRVIKQIAQRLDVVNATNSIGDTALILTVQFKHLQIVQALIAAGANVNRLLPKLTQANPSSPLVVSLSNHRPQGGG